MDRSKDECIADVHMIFKQDKKSVNLDSSEVEDGHWCAPCQKAGLPCNRAFFTGSISSLRCQGVTG
jgi:hypothetical protein